MTEARTLRIKRTMALAVLSAAYFLLFAPLHVRADAECSDVCDSGADCSTACEPNGTCFAYGSCADSCADICNSEISCATACNGPYGSETCGDGFACDSCTANYQPVSGSYVWTGGAEDDTPDDDANNTCTYDTYYEWTMRDTNDCPGSSDYTACGVGGVYHYAPEGQCCNVFSCFGSYCP